MKRNFFRIISPLCVATILSFTLNAHVRASTWSKPVVIRKKIVAQNQKDLKRLRDADTGKEINRLNPKSDISIIFESTEKSDFKIADIKLSKHVPPVYDSEGKIDPFEPLFKETPEIKSGSPQHADTGGNTALEKIDLSQLKLTGIILAASGNRALVQEATGRGHVISKGTPIGTHGGRVAGVLQDKVIVKERMKDVRGKFFFQETELKLNKPDI